MRIITDIDPASRECPCPESAWKKWNSNDPLHPFLSLCFPTDPPMVETEVSGQKLSRQYPLVIWQQYASNSQIDLLSKALAKNLEVPTNLVMVANEGLAFRGHFDRRWAAIQGNLHVTVFVRDELPIQTAGVGYAILPVLTLLDFVRGLSGTKHTVGVKWMNDILLDGAKIGGALSKTRTQGGIFTEAMIGMGVNTNSTPDVAPTVFVPKVGDMSAFTENRTRLELLTRLLSTFTTNHYLLLKEGGGQLVERYRRDWMDLDRRVRIYDDGTGLDDRNLTGRDILARGTIEGVDKNLNLIIGGKSVSRGRLAYEEDCQTFGI
ncbi:hypothetical protein KQI84_18565 [bacterium]|nr:hypothetical protein [bacterium]